MGSVVVLDTARRNEALKRAYMRRLATFLHDPFLLAQAEQALTPQTIALHRDDMAAVAFGEPRSLST